MEMNSGKPGSAETWSSRGNILDEKMESWPKKRSETIALIDP